jgi:hypothetical protein
MRGVAPSKDEKYPKYFFDNRLTKGFVSHYFDDNSSVLYTIKITL